MRFSKEKLPEFERINEALVRAFHKQLGAPDTERSHHFAGRFENIYIKRPQLPEIEPVLDFTLQHASVFLKKPEATLKIGFWFNYMEPGHVTLLHDHVEDDELLSCVYYIDVPEGSGDLLLGEGSERKVITAENGLLVSFFPDTIHEVSQNLSEKPRLSVAMNIGLNRDM